MTTCIGCGCDDSQACVGRGGTPCSWVIVSERRLAGLCSECEQLVPPSRRQLEVDQAEASLETWVAGEDEARRRRVVEHHALRHEIVVEFFL